MKHSYPWFRVACFIIAVVMFGYAFHVDNLLAGVFAAFAVFVSGEWAVEKIDLWRDSKV